MAQPSEAMQVMVKSLAQAPEEQRRAMLSTRLDLFYGMSDQERKEAMKGMVQATAVLNEEELKNIARTRARILSEFRPEKRKTLMRSHMASLMELPME